MDIPMNVDVYCNNTVCGRTNHVVLFPRTRRVTHVVVQEKGLANGEYLVPVSEIVESTSHHIKLNCSKAQLVEMDQFRVSDYVPAELMDSELFDPSLELFDGFLLWPDTRDEFDLPAEHEEVPAGELALVKGAHVVALDGTVGRVDEFLTDSAGKITHLVMRKGHLWDQKDVTIAVDQIALIEDNHVYLKLDKQAVGALPAIAV